jgi:nucleoside-diphosphate-sugar epimerase
MKTFLITGVNGFIGSQIAERLLREGNKVRGLVRKTSDLKFIKDFDIELFSGDITDYESLLIASKGVDQIIHVAALASDWGPYQKFYEINVNGTLNTAKAAKAAIVERMVYISTTAMYGYGRNDVKESDPKTITKFAYNETKRLAEDVVFGYAKESGLKLTAIKPGNVYGVRDHTFIEKYLDAMVSGKIAYVGGGKRKTCPVYIDNLVDLIMLASEKEEAIGETFFATDGMDITWKEFTDKFADEMGLKRPTTSFPFHVAYSAAFVLEMIYKGIRSKNPPMLTRYRISNAGYDYTFSIEKAKSVLGFAPKVDIDTAVKRTCEWYRNR